jgi:class 3 adenylate cyclase
VGADQHLAKLDEVAVLLVVDFDDAPRIATATDLAAIRCADLVGSTNDSERNLGHDLIVLCNGLLIIELVPGTLEDLDLVELDVCKNLHSC